MRLINRRIQYAVGQGGFHAGTLEDGHKKLRYIVDCGSMSKYSESRNQCIDDYLKGEGQGVALDILFITHAHADHLNGIDRLLKPNSGMNVKTIVTPLLTVGERLLCFARTKDVDPREANKSFYQKFTVDPEQALSRFKPEQIIFVESSDGDDGAPFSRDDNGPNSEQNSTKVRTEEQGRRSWDFVGQDKPQQNGTEPQRLTIPDTVGFLFRAGGDDCKWLLATYVDPSIKARTKEFLEKLATQLSLKFEELLIKLEDTKYVKTLITQDVGKLVAAYKTLSKNLNVTSLIVYSGPIHVGCQPHFIKTHNFGSPMRHWVDWSYPNHEGRVGWLGTGDAELKQKNRREAFFKHFGKLLDLVYTFTLPHHGSEGSFDKSLLEKIKPRHCVVAADHMPNWRHPGTSVVQAVASAGSVLSVVTSAKIAQIEEMVFLNRRGA